MIFLDLVGGGGRAKSSLVMMEPDWVDWRFRDISAGEAGDTGRYDESEPLAEGVEEALARSVGSVGKAVGGRLKAGAVRVGPSLPRKSLEEPGVGGGSGRGMVEDDEAAVAVVAVLVLLTGRSGRRAKYSWWE